MRSRHRDRSRLKRVHLDSFEAHRVNGTPADCVALGMHRWGHVDVVLSGINLGLNLGNACWHIFRHARSGEAGSIAWLARYRVQTIVSDSREPDFATLEPYVVRVFELLLPIKTLSLVNVNLPEKPKASVGRGESARHYDGKVVPDKDPAGRPIFWFTVTPLEGAAEGTDRWAVEHGWVSITPLRLDLTDEADLARALALSDIPATKVSGKRRQQRRSSSTSSSKSKSSSRG